MKLKSWFSIVSWFGITVAIVIGYSHLTLAQMPFPTPGSQPAVCASYIQPVTSIDLSTAAIGEVVSELGVARTGAHDDCRRVTPLPRGTRAHIVAEGSGPDRYKKIVPWYQLDYGAWIEASEVQVLTTPIETMATLDRVKFRSDAAKTEIVLPLSAPVPLEIQQSGGSFGITLHNTVNKIVASAPGNGPRLTLENPTGKSQPIDWLANRIVNLDRGVVQRANWQLFGNNQLQLNLQLRSPQQWGYQMAYRGNNLVISLREPPKLSRNPQQPLQNLTVVVDAGHGGIDSGAIGRANGSTYLEKTVNIDLSTYLQRELQIRGARVVMTRTTDINPSLDDRQAIINQSQPVVSISIHHDAATPGRSSGASIYWYHPQSQDFAASLLKYFSDKGDRPILNNNGVIYRSFALARPSIAPAVLLEVGFMTNPTEITDLAQPGRQQQLANVLADGIVQWIAARA
jgi:N-acetylmuramoyl-L-alanine amidase